MVDETTHCKLTILLPLKGKEIYTNRWLSYAKQSGLRFKILIADGSLDDKNKQIVESNNWSELDISYIRHKPDITFNHFYTKMELSLKAITTPYCLIADNDDFYDEDSIRKSINFLDKNREYVASGGMITGFELENSGHYGKVKKKHQTLPKSYSEEKDSDRVVKFLKGNAGPHYCVTKTEVLREIWELAALNKFTDLRLFELFYDIYILLNGKIHRHNSPFYFRQFGHEGENTSNLSNDVMSEFFNTNWSHEMNFIIDYTIENIKGKNLSRNELILLLQFYTLPRLLNSLKSYNQDLLNCKIKNSFVHLGIINFDLKCIISKLVSRLEKPFIKSVSKKHNNPLDFIKN